MKWLTRVKGDFVAAGLIEDPDGGVLLVRRKRKLSLPVGHMHRIKDNQLIDTVFREMGEELNVKAEEFFFVDYLGPLIRDKDRPSLFALIGQYIPFLAKTKFFEYVYLKVGRQTKKRIRYEEAGETGEVWCKPLKALKENVDELDEVARVGLERRVNRYVRHKTQKTLRRESYDKNNDFQLGVANL